MTRQIKGAQFSGSSEEIDKILRSTVEASLSDVRSHGGTAVRKLSAELDKWDPVSFCLSREQTEEIVASVPSQVISDIRFAQQQIRRFAEVQRSAIRDVEVETLPGVVLGHKNIPVDSVGCYIPGGRYPMVASAHMSILTAKVAGARRVLGCTRPLEGEVFGPRVPAMHLGGANEIYILGGVQAIAAMAFGTEEVER